MTQSVQTIHILNNDRNNSMCGGGVLGDLAITYEQVLDGKVFTCPECAKILFKGDTNETTGYSGTAEDNITS